MFTNVIYDSCQDLKKIKIKKRVYKTADETIAHNESSPNA